MFAKRMFSINGNESSTLHVSLENRFNILPLGVISKNEIEQFKSL